MNAVLPFLCCAQVAVFCIWLSRLCGLGFLLFFFAKLFAVSPTPAPDATYRLRKHGAPPPPTLRHYVISARLCIRGKLLASVWSPAHRFEESGALVGRGGL
jgi:hypothetical protein